MLDHLLNLDFTSPAQLVGYVATAVGIGAFAVKDDRGFKLCMAASLVMWAIQYSLFASWTSAATALFIASRQALSMMAPGMSNRGKTIMSAGYMIAFTVILFVSWAGPVSIWPYLAAVNATYAFVYLTGERMRKQVMLSTAFWLVNALMIGSVGHMVSTIVTLAINAWTIVRLRIDGERLEAAKTQERLHGEIGALRRDMDVMMHAFAQAHPAMHAALVGRMESRTADAAEPMVSQAPAGVVIAELVQVPGQSSTTLSNTKTAAAMAQPA